MLSYGMAFTTLISTAALALHVDDPAFAIVDCRMKLDDREARPGVGFAACVLVDVVGGAGRSANCAPGSTFPQPDTHGRD